jgi:hypothetical protein
MAVQPLTGFMHLHSPDGTHAAVCLKCFATVSIERKESDLPKCEATHLGNNPNAEVGWRDLP